MENKPGSSSSGSKDSTPGFEGPQGFAIYPLPWCPHLDDIPDSRVTTGKTQAKCCVCGDCRENWECIICGQILCSRYINNHMVAHNHQTGHCLALSFSDLSVWCYGCDYYVDNERLYEVKNAAHLDKFGEQMVKPSYGNTALHISLA